RSLEGPKDGARWRSMTRKQLIHRVSFSDLRMSLLRQLADVLALDNKDSPKRKDLDADFGDRITAIVRWVLDLNRAIGTQIVSEDLEAVFIELEAKFEPKTMDETWPGDDGVSINDWVLCTTGLELRK
ncbi:hypothetical protein DFH09DRAFT_841876, partial [Mycena vulgaris]